MCESVAKSNRKFKEEILDIFKIHQSSKPFPSQNPTNPLFSQPAAKVPNSTHSTKSPEGSHLASMEDYEFSVPS